MRAEAKRRDQMIEFESIVLRWKLQETIGEVINSYEILRFLQV